MDTKQASKLPNVKHTCHGCGGKLRSDDRVLCWLCLLLVERDRKMRMN